jgi:hypothetical protein
MTNLAYNLFMAETEGYLDTRQGKINKAIKKFSSLKRTGVNINESYIQDKVFKECGLTNLSPKEISQIKYSVK